ASRLVIPRRVIAKTRPWTTFGIRAVGGNLTAGCTGASVTAWLIEIRLPNICPVNGLVPRCTTGLSSTVLCGTQPDKHFAERGSVVTAVAGDAALVDADPFRLRLFDGLASSIGERGYRATTVADIVRHARTSKRTFYDQFASKEECFLELLRADTEKMAED